MKHKVKHRQWCREYHTLRNTRVVELLFVKRKCLNSILTVLVLSLQEFLPSKFPFKHIQLNHFFHPGEVIQRESFQVHLLVIWTQNIRIRNPIYLEPDLHKA